MLDLYEQGEKFRRAHLPRYQKPPLRVIRKKPRYIPTKAEILDPIHRPMNALAKRFVVDLTTMTEGDTIQAVQSQFKGVSLEQADKIAKKLLKMKDVRQALAHYAIGATHRLYLLSIEARSEKVKLDANLGILDRAGYTPPKEQHTHNTLVIQIPEAIARKNGITETIRDI